MTRKTIHSLMLLWLALIGLAWGTPCMGAEASRQTATLPTAHERKDRLWVPNRDDTHQAAVSGRQTCRIGAPRLYDYTSTPGPRPTHSTGHIPYYAKFNPYNQLHYGWLRRQLTASHPHARADYYVYALRHIIR